MKVLSILGLILSCQVWAGNSVNNGGSILPEDRVDRETFRSTITNARLDLLMHLNYLTTVDHSAIVEKLFKASPSIFKIVKTVEIVIAEYSPCQDESGKDADGSSNVGFESICISIGRLDSKLSETNLWPQIVALVAHEYSHRAGFSEADAVQLQREILKNLQTFSHAQVRQSREKFVVALNSFRNNDFERLYQSFVRRAKGIDQGDYGQDPSAWPEALRYSISASVAWYLNTANMWFFYLPDLPFRGLNQAENLVIDSYRIKASALAIGVCLLGTPCHMWNGQPPPPTESAKYQAVFGNRSEVSVEDFSKAFYPQSPDYHPLFNVRKVGGLPEIQLEIAELRAGVEELHGNLGLLRSFVYQPKKR